MLVRSDSKPKPVFKHHFSAADNRKLNLKNRDRELCYLREPKHFCISNRIRLDPEADFDPSEKIREREEKISHPVNNRLFRKLKKIKIKVTETGGNDEA